MYIYIYYRKVGKLNNACMGNLSVLRWSYEPTCNWIGAFLQVVCPGAPGDLFFFGIEPSQGPFFLHVQQRHTQVLSLDFLGESCQEESTLQNGLLWNQNCELLLLSLHNQTKTTEHRRCCDVSPYHARYPLIFQLLKTRSQWPIGGSTHSHTYSNWMMDPKRAQVLCTLSSTRLQKQWTDLLTSNSYKLTWLPNKKLPILFHQL